MQAFERNVFGVDRVFALIEGANELYKRGYRAQFAAVPQNGAIDFLERLGRESIGAIVGSAFPHPGVFLQGPSGWFFVVFTDDVVIPHIYDVVRGAVVLLRGWE